jgi:hypothetical protein
MKRSHPAFIAIVASLNFGAVAGVARAECPDASSVRPAVSSGLSIQVTRVVAQKSSVAIQFAATNTSTVRVYVMDSRGDEVQKGFLASGEHLNPPTTAGIQPTNGRDASGCASTPICSQNLDAYSYIEPGVMVPFSLTYSLPSSASPSNAISMSLAFVVRTARGGSDSGQADSPRVVRFPFNAIPICH